MHLSIVYSDSNENVYSTYIFLNLKWFNAILKWFGVEVGFFSTQAHPSKKGSTTWLIKCSTVFIEISPVWRECWWMCCCHTPIHSGTGLLEVLYCWRSLSTDETEDKRTCDKKQESHHLELVYWQSVSPPDSDSQRFPLHPENWYHSGEMGWQR